MAPWATGWSEPIVLISTPSELFRHLSGPALRCRLEASITIRGAAIRAASSRSAGILPALSRCRLEAGVTARLATGILPVPDTASLGRGTSILRQPRVQLFREPFAQGLQLDALHNVIGKRIGE